MGEGRFSLGQMALFLVVVLTLCGTSLAVGTFFGYQWGRAQGFAQAAERLGRQAFQPPRGPQPPEFLPPQPPEVTPPEAPPGEGAFLGVRFEPVTPAVAQRENLDVDRGALIIEVEPDSPAERGGLEAGDVILEVDEIPVDENHPLQELIQSREPGDRVTLRVWRDGDTLTVRVRLGRRPGLPLPDLPGFLGELRPGLRYRIFCWPEPCPLFPQD